MRRVKIFSGSSHPILTETICARLATSTAPCDLKNFSNGENSVSIGTSIRDQHVFIVQSGSDRINDSVMELLIMVAACKGGSAKSITAVMPYFPYSRQSKKKSHRGVITARLLAKLLGVAGIHHVITVDLHAPPAQGFFGKPVDNLHAEPTFVRWIKANVDGWREAVVVSKNSGGTKRVTSLADVLKLNFALVTTDRRRVHDDLPRSLDGSAFFDRFGDPSASIHGEDTNTKEGPLSRHGHLPDRPAPYTTPPHRAPLSRPSPTSNPQLATTSLGRSSPLFNPARPQQVARSRAFTLGIEDEEDDDGMARNEKPSRERTSIDFADERAREVVTGRLIHGHIVDDDAPSPALSNTSGLVSRDPLASPTAEEADPLSLSYISNASRRGTDRERADPDDASDEEEGLKDPELEHTVTLVGNVQDRIVLIIDDMIDQAGSWIAAAETVVKRGGAKKVYCIATHGLFGNDSLEQMEACECIDWIVVTNTYPIDDERASRCKKLVILDLSHLLAEAIRRNHHGESISSLYEVYPD